MTNDWVNVNTVAMLTGEAPQRIREKVNSGEYVAKTQKGGRGGNGGDSYMVEVSSLPTMAQIIYAENNGIINGPVADGCDLGGYQAKYGQDGIDELLHKQSIVRQGLTIRALNPADIVGQLTDLASGYGTTLRSLYRWMDAYAEQGLPGIMRAMARKDKGTMTSICPAAYTYAYTLYADKVKRTQSTIYTKLCDRARELGPGACGQCLFNEDAEIRMQLQHTSEINQYPPCNDPDKQGMRVPECRQTLSRILNAIPDDELTLARRGVKALKDVHMPMAKREKPAEVNRVWFGDHHIFDAFVLDERGKPVRPWLTGWYDAATGAMVGWVLSTNPNTETITEAFIRAVAPSKHNPFHGLPAAIYIDNGKDYRSKTFETGLAQIKEQSLGYLNSNIASNSVIQLFNVQVHHAVPYHAWSKTIERVFGTIENIWMREVPGWCGGNIEARPEDFAKDLRRQYERGELWTLDEFYVYLRDTVFPEYHDRPNEGHGNKSPMELYSTLSRARDDQPSWAMLSVARQNKEERKIGQQGIKFKNEFYWDDAMIGLAGNDAVILYSKSDISSISVLLDGRFLCEATPKERLQLIGEDPLKLAEHMSKQKGYLRDVRERVERVKRASRCVFADDVDSRKAAANITALEYEKAARARKAKRTEIEQPREDNSADNVRAMFASMGKDLINRAR